MRTVEVEVLSPGLLGQAERRELLRLARQSIAAAAGCARAPVLTNPDPALRTPTAVFVSIHRGDDLRGCVGTTKADRPLGEAVIAMARAAARDDPRFPPVSAAELPLLSIEISRLSPFRRARPEEVHAGSHGVYLVDPSIDARALLLPQVAAKRRWDRERLLTEACRKAGLAREGWRRPTTEVYVFTAEVFGEDES